MKNRFFNMRETLCDLHRTLRSSLLFIQCFHFVRTHIEFFGEIRLKTKKISQKKFILNTPLIIFNNVIIYNIIKYIDFAYLFTN